MNASVCLRCLCRSQQLLQRRAILLKPSALSSRHISSTSTFRSASSELEQQRDEAKKRAWYLDSEEAVTPAMPSRPKFTTFDPSSTLPNPTPSAPPRPLPSNAPAHFTSLHTFLTTSELIEPSSVVFLHTPSSGSLQRDAEELGIGGIGARWEWVVVAVVKGRGKGVVGRAERAVRVWMKDNPIPELHTSASPRRMPRVEAETDWSLVPIGESCVNLFTQEGRDKWDLETLFATS